MKRKKNEGKLRSEILLSITEKKKYFRLCFRTTAPGRSNFYSLRGQQYHETEWETGKSISHEVHKAFC